MKKRILGYECSEGVAGDLLKGLSCLTVIWGLGLIAYLWLLA